MDISYSPYKEKRQKGSWIKLPKINFPKSLKKWLGILVGIIILIFLIFYLLLGELRFFANHFFGLTFFSKHYLVLLQNNYELRPGGGFITGYGDLDTFMGLTKNLSFKNSYDIDTKNYVTPPYPHEELLKNEWYEGYTFRDANWHADFPESTEELIKFYQEKFPDEEVDGIIVMNFSLIEDLVDELGGIELDGKTLNKNSLFSELEFEVNNIDRHDTEALKNRKNILGDLAVQLMSKAKRHPFKTRDLIVQGLNDKNIYLWLENERLENKLIEKGWANTLKLAGQSDFLAVNLANLGSKKADRYVQTEVNYYANIIKELPEITTEVTIRYPGYTNTYSDNYKGYLRLYVPKNAEIESVPVDSKTETAGDFNVIGTKIILPAGSKTSLSYTYTLPRSTFETGKYKLRLIKQSGSETFYKLTVETTEGRLMEGDDFETRENRAMFMGWLKNDMDLSLDILGDTLPPYPIEQKFISLTEINIIWNEPLDETSAIDMNKYDIADMNKKDENTDVVKIKSIELIQPNVAKLTLEGVTEQDLEQYRIDMKGVKDLTGNAIEPDPKSITVVQRLTSASVAPAIDLGEIDLGEVPATTETTEDTEATEDEEQPAQ